MTLGEFMDQLLAMREAVERGDLTVENMRYVLVYGTLGISAELTAHYVHAGDDEILECFMEQLNRAINIMNNEFAARWN